MDNAVIRRFGRGRVALSLPLAGLVIFWVLVITAAYLDLFVANDPHIYNHPGAEQNVFHVSSYLWLVGLTLLGLASATARRMTYANRENRLENAVRGFSLVSVFVSLIIAAIWGISIFMSNFNRYSYAIGTPDYVKPDELMRVFNVYVPIVLVAGLMVFVILRSFVGLQDGTAEESADE